MRYLCIPVLACFLNTPCHRAVPAKHEAPPKPAPALESVSALEIGGQYVESRTASVFAGACHYGSEYTTCGREALLAWHFDTGTWRGVDLAGANVVLAVVGDENLATGQGAHRSIVYTDAKGSSARNEAAVDLVLTHCGDLAGKVERRERAALDVSIGDETYAVAAPGVFELRGSKLANRACCHMPFDVWYTPFVDGVAPVVGCNSNFQFEDKTLGPVWKRSGQNESFVGRFAWSAAPVVPVAPAASVAKESRQARAEMKGTRPVSTALASLPTESASRR